MKKETRLARLILLEELCQCRDEKEVFYGGQADNVFNCIGTGDSSSYFTYYTAYLYFFASYP